MSTIKILWIAHEANKSGANICLQEFMTLTAEKNIHQHLVLPHPGNMQLVSESLAVANTVVHFYGWMKQLQPPFYNRSLFRRRLRNLFAIAQLCRIIQKEKITVVFTNTSTTNVGARAATLMRKKHFWYVHELGEEDFGMSLPQGKKSAELMNKWSEKLFSNSDYLLRKYQDLFPGIKMSVLRNPVLMQTAFGLAENRKPAMTRLLMLGQVTRSKGQHTAIEAVRLLKEKGKDVGLLILGGAQDVLFLEELHNMVKRYNLQDQISFECFTDSPAEVISNHDVLLICSKCEAFGRVTIEAMKLGVPVIGANTCGTAEIIIHKESGLLYENANATSLADAIKLLSENEQLRDNIVEGGRRRAMEMSGPKDFNLFLESMNTN